MKDYNGLSYTQEYPASVIIDQGQSYIIHILLRGIVCFKPAIYHKCRLFSYF